MDHPGKKSKLKFERKGREKRKRKRFKKGLVLVCVLSFTWLGSGHHSHPWWACLGVAPKRKGEGR
jgi:hypothetical protein